MKIRKKKSTWRHLKRKLKHWLGPDGWFIFWISLIILILFWFVLPRLN